MTGRKGLMMTINKLLTPINYSSGSESRIKYIVIHYVGATGGAEANCKYYASQYVGASAHYYVGFNGEIWQSVEDKNIAWHCGTKGKYYHSDCRNSNSIGIELCVRNKGSMADTSRDWYFEDATITAAIALTKELMKKYSIPVSNIIRHYDITHKICPNPFVYNHTKHTWNTFKSALNSVSDTGDYVSPTYAIRTGTNGLRVHVNGTLNVRAIPSTGSVIGTLKDGDQIFPNKKCFINGTPWYYLPDKNGWISAKYIDGGWVYESTILSPYKWWYIHKDYTCTTGGIEIIDGKIYKFDDDGYMLENTTGKYMINKDGEVCFD